MVIDVHRLIQQVSQRPALWDRHNPNYCRKEVVSRMWKEIASSHSVHEAKIKKRWKALRDHFREQLRKSGPITWPYFNDMIFLKKHLKVKVEPEPKIEKNIQGILEARTINENEFNENFQSTEMDYSPVEMDPNRGACNHDPEDDDYHFLLSLLPAMRRLPPNQKFLFRIKLMEFLHKEMYQ